MQTFFSRTDSQELIDNVDKYFYYLSLIVNYRGEYTAKIAYLAHMKENFKTKNDKKYATKPKEVIALVELEVSHTVDQWFSEKAEELKKSAKPTYGVTYGGAYENGYGSRQNHYNPYSSYNSGFRQQNQNSRVGNQSQLSFEEQTGPKSTAVMTLTTNSGGVTAVQTEGVLSNIEVAKILFSTVKGPSRLLDPLITQDIKNNLPSLFFSKEELKEKKIAWHEILESLNVRYPNSNQYYGVLGRVMQQYFSWYNHNVKDHESNDVGDLILHLVVLDYILCFDHKYKITLVLAEGFKKKLLRMFPFAEDVINSVLLKNDIYLNENNGQDSENYN